ncbi:MAG TPA: ATP-binding cassette domain-containing protein [Saprospiraceae bacterium]|nr:ATP-binding cassette domain-containing protein [Saprospiraceae bacterium]
MVTYTPVQRFFRLLQPNKDAIRNLYIFAIFNGLIALSLPLGIQAIINLIQGGEVSASWILLVAIVLIGYILNGLLQIFQLRITEDLQKDIFTRSAFEFAYRIPRIRMDALQNQYAPELMNRFFDTISIQKGVAKVLLEMTAAALSILFGLILLSFYHPFFIIFSVLIIVLGIIIGSYIFQRGLKSSIVESKYKYKVAFWLEEVARTNTTFRLSCDTSLPVRKTDVLVEKYLDAREGHFKILLRQYYLFIFFKILIAAGFLILGGILVFNQQMNIGQFVAAEIVILLLISSTEKLLLTLEVVYDLLTSIEKIGQVTDLELEKSSGHSYIVNEDQQGMSVSIHNLYFKYPDGVDYSLQDFNLDIKSNEKITLTGSNGSGKATLLKLMTAFFEPQRGNIIYDNIPIKNYDVTQLRSYIAECISEDRIFEGTLLENLTVGRDISQYKISEVLDNIGLTSFIHQLPQGYNTEIGPQGKRLPGSVTQKIILARNLLKEPRLMIVEDIFKNIEKKEKLLIFKYILQKNAERTVIVVSKDPDIMQLTDRIITLDDGKVVDTQIVNKK